MRRRVPGGFGGRLRFLAGVLLVASLSACLTSAPDPNDVVIAAATPVPRTATPTSTPSPPTATPATTATAAPAVPTPTPTSAPTPAPNPELAAEIAPAVVRVTAQRRILDQATGVVSRGSKTESGFLISPDGYILTTYHGVGGATEIEVEVPDFGVRPATLVGASQCSDLALLKIADGNYRHLRLSQVKVALRDTIYVAGIEAGSGEFVFVPGTVRGVLVQYANAWAMPHNVIRHDIDASDGAIGGPVVDERGRVVGISYADATLRSDGFAVGSRHINDVRAGLRGGKNVTWLGALMAVTEENALRAGLEILAIDAGSPADLMEFEIGDVIRYVNQTQISYDTNTRSYCELLERYDLGYSMYFEIHRPSADAEFRGRINPNTLVPLRIVP